jgi:hypothetical protein
VLCHDFSGKKPHWLYLKPATEGDDTLLAQGVRHACSFLLQDYGFGSAGEDFGDAGEFVGVVEEDLDRLGADGV